MEKAAGQGQLRDPACRPRVCVCVCMYKIYVYCDGKISSFDASLLLAPQVTFMVGENEGAPAEFTNEYRKQRRCVLLKEINLIRRPEQKSRNYPGRLFLYGNTSHYPHQWSQPDTRDPGHEVFTPPSLQTGPLQSEDSLELTHLKEREKERERRRERERERELGNEWKELSESRPHDARPLASAIALVQSSSDAYRKRQKCRGRLIRPLSDQPSALQQVFRHGHPLRQPPLKLAESSSFGERKRERRKSGVLTGEQPEQKDLQDVRGVCVCVWYDRCDVCVCVWYDRCVCVWYDRCDVCGVMCDVMFV
ncbi:hypothetical protein P4O66_004158 [Electrophorus voltai]|uniref:Uncharacterized protein n=1 Tax=Electrophorus voltai TaxID=2609070 RepID=A0AAD9E326_9TELE|nr:hypothetical protein P4O66_004158 [Electrophorus voltai]